ncbi:MAG: hypothetical protein JXC85_03270 [Candidatus Aenigmarchaeota archaeon]|nr:hypothetical protein [Candidatus Aenigmarchaeota archaeon]
MGTGGRVLGTILLLITAIVLSSGCVIPGFGITPVTGNGVIITEWKPDFPKVYSGEKVTFYANVNNAGSFDAMNVHFQLFDLDGWDEIEPVGFDCQSSGTSLLAANPQYGTRGEEKTCSWTAVSPSIERGLHMVYSPKVMVCYDYLSTATLRTPSISRAELKRLQDAGDGLPSQGTMSSGSPLSVSASTPSPIIMTASHVTFPVKISVTNGGGGMFCIAGEKSTCTNSDKMNKVTLDVISSTAIVVDCPDELVFLGNKGEVTCDLRIISGADTLVENDIDISARYRYCVDASTSIEVQGM